jgi:hypothetical protein
MYKYPSNITDYSHPLFLTFTNMSNQSSRSPSPINYDAPIPQGLRHLLTPEPETTRLTIPEPDIPRLSPPPSPTLAEEDDIQNNPTLLFCLFGASHWSRLHPSVDLDLDQSQRLKPIERQCIINNPVRNERFLVP